MVATDIDLQKIVDFIQGLANLWGQSIAHPRSYLHRQFVPSSAEIAAGLQFYLEMLSISTVFYLALALRHKGDLGDKLRLVANGVFGILSSGLVAMAWYLPFRLVGGKSDIGGTYLAMAYGAGPYTPLVSFCSLLTLAGVSEQARSYLVNPATAQQGYQIAANDPNTSTSTILSGCLLLGILTVVSSFVTFSCMGYVHDIHSWRFFAAITLSILLFIPVSLALQKIAALFA